MNRATIHFPSLFDHGAPGLAPKPSLSAIAAAVALLTFLGGGMARAEEPSGPTTAVPHDEAEQAVDLRDEDVTLAIERRLLLDPDVAAGRLDVQTVDGVAMLQGRLDNFLAHRLALGIAGSTRGVRSVVDRIQVAPVRRPDAAIARDVTSAFRYDRSVEAGEVEVEVEDGVVTLSGTVDSFTEAQLASRNVEGVRGVRSVVNELRVEDGESRPDDEVAADVRGRLVASVWISEDDVNVEVRDGVVRLVGAVSSVEQLQRIVAASWVVGARRVDVTKLDVQPDRVTSSAKPRRPRPDDATIRRAVEAALAYDPRVRGTEVTVRVRAHDVILRGKVDSLAARRAAEEDARNTAGVARVRNHLRVRPASDPTDEEIRRAIEAAYLRDAVVGERKVEVLVENGHVHLFGTLRTMWERARAIDLAAAATGVVGVEAHLEVPVRVNLRPDREIALEIREQLWWDAMLDGDAIHVTVSGGTATLRGEVGSPAELRRVIERARQAGAVRVVDRLELVPPYVDEGS